MPEPSSSDNRTDPLHAVMEPAGGLAVSAHTEAVSRAGRTSLGVRLSDWITQLGRYGLALEQLHGQQLSDFENEDTDSLEEPDELVD